MAKGDSTSGQPPGQDSMRGVGQGNAGPMQRQGPMRFKPQMQSMMPQMGQGMNQAASMMRGGYTGQGMQPGGDIFSRLKGMMGGGQNRYMLPQQGQQNPFGNMGGGFNLPPAIRMNPNGGGMQQGGPTGGWQNYGMGGGIVNGRYQPNTSPVPFGQRNGGITGGMNRSYAPSGGMQVPPWGGMPKPGMNSAPPPPIDWTPQPGQDPRLGPYQNDWSYGGGGIMGPSNQLPIDLNYRPQRPDNWEEINRQNGMNNIIGRWQSNGSYAS